MGHTSIALAVGGWEEVDLLARIRDRGDQVIWVPTMTVKHYVDPRRMAVDYLLEYTKALGHVAVAAKEFLLARRFLACLGG